MGTIRTPEGLISLRYLWPGLSAAQRVHRTLLARSYPGRPRVLAAALHAMQWARWVTFGGWRAVGRAVAVRGDRVAETFGVSLSDQRRWAVFYAMVHALAPADFYRFQLYLPEQRKEFWNYVYGAETGAFHRWRSRVDDADARALLSDKLDFERRVTRAGVRTTVTERSVPRGSSASVLDGLADGRWFCKPRVGAQAAGVFHLSVDGPRRSIARLQGTAVDGDGDTEIERRFAVTDYLVQRAVESHDFVAPLLGRQEATTLRVITEREPDSGSEALAMSAVLEVPGDRDRYVVHEVDVATGRIAVDAVDPHRWRQPHERGAKDRFGDLLVPFWEETLTAARAAHDIVPSIFGVAWDFIIAADGPVLLEGNSGWSTVMPQRIGGPYLAALE